MSGFKLNTAKIEIIDLTEFKLEATHAIAQEKLAQSTKNHIVIKQINDEGIDDGPIVAYAKNSDGSIRMSMSGQHKNGLLDGVVKRISVDNTITETVFTNGQKNGLEKVTAAYGTVLSNGSYKNGKKIGQWEETDRNAKLTSNYDDNGALHGSQKYETAYSTEEIIYDHGEPVSKEINHKNGFHVKEVFGLNGTYEQYRPPEMDDVEYHRLQIVEKEGGVVVKNQVLKADDTGLILDARGFGDNSLATEQRMNLALQNKDMFDKPGMAVSQKLAFVAKMKV